MDPIYRIAVDGQARWAWRRGEAYVLLDGDPIQEGISGLRETHERVPLTETTLLPPCGRSKVLGLAYNYKSLTGGSDHEEPLFFFKSVTSLIGHGQAVTIPAFVERVWVEVELALVISRRGANIATDDAHRFVLGHTIGNDITAVNVHGRDHHLARSKGLDNFCPLGPCLLPGMPNPNLKIETRINGRVTQSGNTSDRILDDAGSIAMLSRYVTLEPGDVILTGTCAGAMESVVRAGDAVVVSVEGIGQLRTRFV
jgi:2-keto-4-pentenoate hydratase/2-oxohepta-3-ene-1,7-dioic acid hydratase in catechol pathway